MKAGDRHGCASDLPLPRLLLVHPADGHRADATYEKKPDEARGRTTHSCSACSARESARERERRAPKMELFHTTPSLHKLHSAFQAILISASHAIGQSAECGACSAPRSAYSFASDTSAPSPRFMSTPRSMHET